MCFMISSFVVLPCKFRKKELKSLPKSSKNTQKATLDCISAIDELKQAYSIL